MQVPSHIGLIMDGNGRWALAAGKPRYFGHKAGLKSLKNIVFAASAQPQIKRITAFALSRDNFKRSANEINALIELLEHVLLNEADLFIEHGVSVNFIGDLSVFSTKIQGLLEQFSQATAAGSDLMLDVAINYSGQQNLLTLMPEALKTTEPEAFLNAKLPMIDLLIRTSGEQRLSDLCLWQLAYSELYFTKTLWPDFAQTEFAAALAWYAERERRFGEIHE